MAKKKTEIPRLGTENAADLYLAVGVALSYWEAAEDAMMSLFRWLCGRVEPVAFAAYVNAPRKVRVFMLCLAIETYRHRLLDAEIEKLTEAISSLDRLASVRNQIAHGTVSKMTLQKGQPDGRKEKIADGNYLLPSLSELGWQQRDFKFHHTAETVNKFEQEVRDHRWTIMQIEMDAFTREQNSDDAAAIWINAARKIALEVAAYKIRSADVENYMKPLV